MKELKTQFINALLVVLTTASVICAFFSFQQNFHPQKRYRLPQDGVTWVDRKAPDGKRYVEALHVEDKSPGDNVGIRVGDRLLRIANLTIDSAVEASQILIGIGPYGNASYLIERNGVAVPISKLVVGERIPSYATSYQYAVGIAYLLIGLFVYFRRGNSPRSLHFLFLCLVSFIFSTFHYTGKLNPFDQVIYWGNLVAEILAPTIFLHFCLTFPEPRKWIRPAWVRIALYVPAAAVIAVSAGIIWGNIRIDMSPIELRWYLDRAQLAYCCLLYLLGAVALAVEYHRADDPILRQQVKWLRNGAFLGVVPFVAVYAIPYVAGFSPTPLMQLGVISLPLIPLTWAYAIVRYRLMDVDVIFQQGYVYTLATLAVLGVFYGLFLALGNVDTLSPSAIVTLILVTAFVFQPIRNWIQEQLDRYYFYRDRYDYRRTLVEFGRELSSETDLDPMLASVADRLIRTLSIRHVAFFLRDDDGPDFMLVKTTDPTVASPLPGSTARLRQDLDLSFLPAEPHQPYIFFERTRHAIDIVSREMPPTVRRAISELDLTYYMPCTVRGRTIAYLGVSRTDKGDFLSSDDLELLVTMSGYVAIAVENARLYRSLQQKVDEYERLKEFSENIVESINVGVLAVDLEDRVESWNTEIERLTGISRAQAVGQTLAQLFPEELCDRFDQVKGETGIHNIYKFVLKPQERLVRYAVNGNGNGHIKSTQPRESILNIAIAPLISREQLQIGRLIIFDDITDRAELEKQLVQADKLSSIGLLAAGVAHEVNTPLAVISTYAQMLAKQIPGDDQKTKLLERIAKQTFRASEIVNSLLNFSRTSAAEFDDIDLNRIVSDTVSLVNHQLEKASVKVDMHLDSSLPGIKGNAGKLQQVFLNLVLNARDAMDRGGTLTVRTRSDGDHVIVHVRDTGQGIPPEHLQRIYDPFFTTKGAKKGTGLGLSVSYGIVREHGGNIEVQSELGNGTDFRLEFPLARKPVNA